MHETAAVTDKVRLVNRPDKELPRELRHDSIRKVNSVSSNGVFAFEIIFDSDAMPVGYDVALGDDWEIRDARIKHEEADGLLGIFGREDACLSILVANEVDLDFSGGGTK